MTNNRIPTIDITDLRDKLFEMLNGSHIASLGTFERRLLSKRPDLHQAVGDYWEHDVPPSTFMEQVYSLFHDDPPVCQRGNRRHFESFTKGYYNCGKIDACECASEQYKATMVERHGADHPHRCEKIKEKFEDTLQERFGTTKLSETNPEQKEATCIERYGTSTPLENKEILAQTRETLYNNHGVNNPFESPLIRQKIQDNWAAINPNGQRSFVRTAEHGAAYSRKYAAQHFKGNYHVLFDAELLTAELLVKSKTEIANEYGCSTALIEKQITKFELDQFRAAPSHYEILISLFLTEHNLNHIRNTFSIIKPFELDFWIPEHNLAIEFCGLNWHGEKHNRGEQYHLNKYNMCRDKGIQLIQIYEDEWDYHSDIVRDIILKYVGDYGTIVDIECI